MLVAPAPRDERMGRAPRAQLRYKLRVSPKIAALSCFVGWMLLCSACEQASVEAPTPPPAPQAKDPDLEDPLGRAIAKLADAHARGFTKQEKLMRGTLEARGRQGFLAVLTYGKCYRLLASGGPGVVDLDLVLLDPNGVEILRDTTEEPTAIVSESSPICPEEAGAYRIEARARSGEGPFAIGLYESAH